MTQWGQPGFNLSSSSCKERQLLFVVGVKFTTYQVLETKGVLFIKISDGFTIGILGLSSMSLPSKQFNIGYVELAFCAYSDSGEQVLMAKASLTDASYLFDKIVDLLVVLLSKLVQSWRIPPIARGLSP